MTATLEIKLLDYWQVSSGKSSGMDSDMSPVKNDAGFPYIPGRVIKGLFFDAFGLLSKSSNEILIKSNRLFGLVNHSDGSGQESSSYFGNAKLPIAVQTTLKNENLKAMLFQKIASTAIEDDTAKNQSLRKIEYCIPLTLEASLSLESESDFTTLEQCCGLIKALGSSRNKGFGRCQFTLKLN